MFRGLTKKYNRVLYSFNVFKIEKKEVTNASSINTALFIDYK